MNRPNLQKPLYLLWPLAKPYQGQLAGGILAMIISSVMMLSMGWGLKEILDDGFAKNSSLFLDRSLLILFGIILVMATASYARLRLIQNVAERVTADLRKKIYRHLLSLDMAYFEQNKTGDQVSKINADTTVLQLIISLNFPVVFRHFLMMAGGVVLLCVVSPSMTGYLLLSVPFVIAPLMYYGRRVRKQSHTTQGKIGDVGSYSHETLAGIQTIQSFLYEDTAASLFDKTADSAYAAARKYISVRARLMASIITIVFTAIGVILWAGGHRVLEGQMSAGDLSAFIFYAVTVAGSVMALGEAYGDLSRASGAAERIIEALNTKPALKQSPISLPGKIAGNIGFENVTFKYPSRLEKIVLDRISFQVKAGEVAALVGPSGAGKTTIFQLLQRFYDPAEGTIRLDQHNIADYNTQDIRRHFGVVPQDPAIFSLSIADNIRIAKPEATDAEVQKAAELAQAHEFIKLLPDGYNTIAGERGNLLSGGQRQRIAIARAILKNPEILLLDEATSALDSSNEQAVHLALKTLMKGRTTIVIAHRLSTVQSANKIFVMEEGRLIAEGTHAELYGKNPLYTHLAGLQLDIKAG